MVPAKKGNRATVLDTAASCILLLLLRSTVVAGGDVFTKYDFFTDSNVNVTENGGLKPGRNGPLPSTSNDFFTNSNVNVTDNGQKPGTNGPLPSTSNDFFTNLNVNGTDNGSASNDNGERLLNANRATLDSMTSPHNFYFLEFPSDPTSSSSPICGDGSPFSFAFRRGSDEHLNKLVVEFQGGPACFDGDCCEMGSRQVVWNNVSSDTLPPLDSCPGIPTGFVQQFSSVNGNDAFDGPITLRQESSSTNQWWQALGSADSDIRDWSYILIPHCTMDWHLGHAVEPTSCSPSGELTYHRGGVNMEAVMNWVVTQFATTGLDAMITTSGGRVGGCRDIEDSSSIAPVLFASSVANVLPASESSMLVLMEGSSLWNSDMPGFEATMLSQWDARLSNDGLLATTTQHILNSPNPVLYAWLSSESAGSGPEEEWLTNMKTTRLGSFHTFMPSAINDSSNAVCPKFAFPESRPVNQEKEIFDFLKNVRNHMTWHSIKKSTEMHQYDSGLGELSFLSIFVICLSLGVLAWVGYRALRFHRTSKGLPPPISPSELWMRALVYYPGTFLVISVAIPLALSFVAIARSGYTININLNFNTYLEIDSDLDRVADNYAVAEQYQEESFATSLANCESLTGMKNRRTLELPEEVTTSDRNLQSPGEEFTYASGGQLITLIYQNRRGGNVFVPEVLQQIYEFEQSIRQFPGFTNYCVVLGGQCLPFDSLAARFFDSGRLRDIDTVLRTFVKSKQDIWKVDQSFGPGKMESDIARTFIWLKNVGGDQSAANPFLEKLYHDLFWKEQNSYPDMIFTWENSFLQELEAQEALTHDTLWSVGSLCFIGLMILFKVQDVFIFFFSILGLLLAFTTSYYWCLFHFDIQQITLLHVSGLFVMLGIGADDIFLMIDSFDHSKIDCGADIGSEPDGMNVIRRRMRWAYSTAGSMMLVSSLTTAVCFFSNAFGVLLVVQQFGIFMGMVVLTNFLHVMTILPSAIMVNEMYIKPRQLWRRKAQSTVDLPQLQSEDCVAEVDEEDEEQQLNRIDSWLLQSYAPFVSTRKITIFFISIAFAAIMAYLGITSFEPSDGSIVLFSKKYNQGRLTGLNDDYFNENLSKSIQDIGSNQGLPDVEYKIGDNGGYVVGGTGSGGGGSGSNNGNNGGGGGSENGGDNGQSSPPDADADVSPITGPVQDGVDNLQRQEEIIVRLIWGIDASTRSNPWRIKKQESYESGTLPLLQGFTSNFDVSEEAKQKWLYDVVQYARGDASLDVQRNSSTWIELLHDFATMNNLGFPIPRHQFFGYIDILRSQSKEFDSLVQNEIGTHAPGFAGQAFYASITLRADVTDTAGTVSLNAYKSWSSFTSAVNRIAPPGMAPVVAQSNIFWNGYRTQETVNSTVVTWLIANGLCFVIILLFTRNMLLCLMVMGTVTLIFLGITGWLFAVFRLLFGPVEALGVSIFIGLSANYSLHVVHSYHRSRGSTRGEKVEDAIFLTGSPIIASALSTLAGCAFLFGCRTWALVELGILISCVTGMALLYSMGFLLAWLSIFGPLPYPHEQDDASAHRLHHWDLAACFQCLRKDREDEDSLKSNPITERNEDAEEAPVNESKTKPLAFEPSSSNDDTPSDDAHSTERTNNAVDSNGPIEKENKLERLRRRKDAIELWHKDKKEGSSRSLMSYMSA